MSWWKKVINFFKPLPADELLNPLKDVKKEEPVVEEVVEEVKPAVKTKKPLFGKN